jgi:hypothetical protein
LLRPRPYCSRKIFIHRGPIDPGAASTEPLRLQAGRARRKIKKPCLESLFRTRLRICEIYSSWLYRILSFVSVLSHTMAIRSRPKLF